MIDRTGQVWEWSGDSAYLVVRSFTIVLRPNEPVTAHELIDLDSGETYIGKSAQYEYGDQLFENNYRMTRLL